MRAANAPHLRAGVRRHHDRDAGVAGAGRTRGVRVDREGAARHRPGDEVGAVRPEPRQRDVQVAG